MKTIMSHTFWSFGHKWLTFDISLIVITTVNMQSQKWSDFTWFAKCLRASHFNRV